MACQCDVCGKKPLWGRQISHAHNVSPRVRYPNLQRVRVKLGPNKVRRIRVCTRCLKAGKVVKAA